MREKGIIDSTILSYCEILSYNHPRLTPARIRQDQKIPAKPPDICSSEFVGKDAVLLSENGGIIHFVTQQLPVR